MSIVILDDPMETNANWVGPSTIVAGRTGNCVRVAGTAPSIVYTIPAGQRSGETKVDLWYRASSIAAFSSTPIVQLRGPGGVPYATASHTVFSTFRFTIGGPGGNLIGVEATVPAANTWAHVELYVKPGVSNAGRVNGRLNGVDLTGDDPLNTASASPVESVALWGNGTGGAGTHDFDDLVLTDESATVPPTPIPAPPLNMAGVVVGFEHTITPGRWVSTLHTSTSTPSY